MPKEEFQKQEVEIAESLKEIVLKVVENIKKNPILLDHAVEISLKNKGKITVDNLATLCANHNIDDLSEFFGISKNEAHTLRAFFTDNANKKILLKIREINPELFDTENPDFFERLV